MSENNDDVPVTIQTAGSDTIESTDKERFEELFKKLFENQQKILKELQSVRNEQSEVKKKQEVGSTEDLAQKSDIKIPNEDAAGPTGSEMQNPIFEKTGKWFVLKHTFKNLSKLEEGERVCSKEQEHFGIIWNMDIRRNKEHLGFFTWCANKEATGLWSIETNCEVKLMTSDGNPEIRTSCDLYKKEKMEEIKESVGLGWENFKKWDELEQNYFVDDNLTFEVSFKVKNATGIYKDNLRSFDDPECSDIVLVVQDKKFYVSKLYLAAHSSYFKVMFLGMFGEAKKAEIKLSGVDADDFQNYLEVLYAEPAVNEYTVEGILMIADMYDTQIALKKCGEFLLKESTKALSKKLELSVRYNLEELKKQCLSKIRTTKDIRAVLPPNIRDMDPSILADLFEKLLATK